MTVNLPKDWSEVTLEQFIALHDLYQMEGDEVERWLAILEIMSGVSIEDLREVRVENIQRMISHLSFLKTPIVGKINNFFPLRWNGYKVVKTAKDLSAGQYIDLNYFLGNVESPKNFPDIMAILMQPTRFGFVRKKKPLEHADIRTEALQLPMTLVKPLTDFFLRAYGDLERATVDYSLRKMRAKMREIQDQVASTQDMDGSGSFITSPTETGQSGNTSLK